MVAGPAPAPRGEFAIYTVAEFVMVRAVAADMVGLAMFTKLNPVAVVMLVEPVMVMVSPCTSKASRTAPAEEATVTAVSTVVLTEASNSKVPVTVKASAFKTVLSMVNWAKEGVEVVARV